MCAALRRVLDVRRGQLPDQLEVDVPGRQVVVT
jgi:hypothetical protein